MLTMVLSDYRRLMRLRSTWLLLIAVLAVVMPTIVKWYNEVPLGAYAVVEVSTFFPLLPDQAANTLSGMDLTILARDSRFESRLMARLIGLLNEFEFVSAAVSVLVGVFFAQKIASRYEAVQRSRGLTRASVLAANLLTILLFAATFVTLSLVSMLICLAIAHWRPYNPLATAWTSYDQYLSQLALAPALHLIAIIASGTLACFFTGSMAYLLARTTRNISISAVGAVTISWIWGSVAGPLNVPYMLTLPADYSLRFMGWSVPDIWSGIRYPIGYLSLGLAIFASLFIYSATTSHWRARRARTGDSR